MAHQNPRYVGAPAFARTFPRTARRHDPDTYAFALGAAREKVQQLLDLFPELQQDFTMNGTDPDSVPSRKKTESPSARARRLRYQKEYRDRRKAEQDGTPASTKKRSTLSAAGRKKLSQAMTRRWKMAKNAGTTLMAKTEKTADAPKTKTAQERKNRLQRAWRANQKKQKGVK